MVLKVGADTWSVERHFDAVLAQKLRRSDPRELEDLRGPDAACAEDHFAGRMRRDGFVAVPDLRANAASAAIGLCFEQEPRHLRARPEFEVRAAIAGRTQE